MQLPPDLAKKALEGRVSMACFSRRTPKCAFRVNHPPYALQSGKRTVGLVTVLEVREATTSSLDLNDARKMGFRTRTDFFERWKGSQDVWLVRFTLGDHTDTPRMPAAKFGAHGDYTTSASQSLHGSSEEVSSTLQSRFATQGRENLALSHSIPRERLIEAVKEILPAPRNAKDRKQMRTIEHEARRYQVDRATETC